MKKIIKFALLFIISAAYVLPVMPCPYGDKKSHMDTDKDGNVSSAEWNEQFKAMDTNGDGKISEEEMKKHHDSMKKEHGEKHGEKKEKK